MNIDLKVTQLALKVKNLVILDTSFPDTAFPEFKKTYAERYWHLPCTEGAVLGIAAGLASMGKIVLVNMENPENFDSADPSLNVKLIKKGAEAVWDYFEGELLEFGPAVLLIPESN